MAKITELTTLGKTSVTSTDYLLSSNSARQDSKKFALADLFPSLSTVGSGGQNLYVDVASKNNLRFKGIIAANNKVGISTVSDNIQVAINEANIDLNNCDNTTSLFLSSVNLASNVTGTLPVANGGTNATAFADKSVVITQDSGTDTLSAVDMSTNGKVLIGGVSGPAAATLTAGTNVSIVNGDGSITINSTLASVASDLDMNNNDIDLGTGYVSSDGASNGIRVTGNNAYVGPSGSYFNTATLNLNGGIDFKSGAAHTIQVASGGSPSAFSIKGQTNTSGVGGDLELYAGAGSGANTGGALRLYAGDSGSAKSQDIEFHSTDSGTSRKVAAINNAGDLTLSIGSLKIPTATEGIVHSGSGTVTQATSWSTGVTLNATTGVITLEASGTLAAHGEASFVVTNSAAQVDSLIFTELMDFTGTAQQMLNCMVTNRTNGTFTLKVYNPRSSGGSTTAGDIRISFMIINNS